MYKSSTSPDRITLFFPVTRFSSSGIFPPYIIAESPISIHKVTSQHMLLHFQSHRILGPIVAIPFSASDIVKDIVVKYCWVDRFGVADDTVEKDFPKG